MGKLPARRPRILNPLSLFGFVLSFLNLAWIVFIGILFVIAGLASWLLGPVAGLVGSFLAVLIIAWMILQSLLSVLLFVAAWKTWKGLESGRAIFLIWAWITVVIDLLDLAFTAGIDAGAWVRLVFAVYVIFVMNREDVRSYFVHNRSGRPYGKPDFDHEWD